MKVGLHKTVTFLGASITSINFILSVIYSGTDPGSGLSFTYLLGNLGKGFQFLFYTILAVVASFVTIKIVAWIEANSEDMALKMAIIAIATILFAWLVSFDVRQSFFNYILQIKEQDGDLMFVYFVLGVFYLLFYVFFFQKLKQEFIRRGTTSVDSVALFGGLVPEYIGAITLISYVLILLLSGFIIP